MENKPGYLTTELWLGVATAIISILIAYGIISNDEASAWQALAAAVVPLALAMVSQSYSKSRATVKTAQMETGVRLESMRLESMRLESVRAETGRI